MVASGPEVISCQHPQKQGKPQSRRFLLKNLSAVALTNSMSSVAINPVPNSTIGSKLRKKCFGASNALTMRCDEKFRLVMECTEAAGKYSDSVLDLNAKSGVSAHEEYAEQKRVV